MARTVHKYFEWDDAKERLNLKRHGVLFIEAATVFDDPLMVAYYSEEHSLEEERYVILGLSDKNRLLAVVYTQRERIRIIAARELTPRERRSYEESEKEF